MYRNYGKLDTILIQIFLDETDMKIKTLNSVPRDLYDLTYNNMYFVYDHRQKKLST